MHGPIAYDYLPPVDELQLERVVETRAADLQPGDRLVRDGHVTLTIGSQQPLPPCAGLIGVPYDSPVGSGWRVFPTEQVLQVRRLEIVGH